jgi:glycosyltransferase involved in cell wall biosynthesis
VTDATILIPTHRHPSLLPYAMRSALGQEGADVEVFVVGDGVEDDTREALDPFLAESRVRFFDFPKGERHGERLRHQALGESTAPIVSYLSDDDLLLPGHVAQMQRLLADADLARDAPVNIWPDGSLRYNAFNLGRPEFAELLVAGGGGGGLTGASHTRDAYDRLPLGWHPAPVGVPTDVHMWQQFLSLPGFRGVSAERLTSLVFPSPLRRHMSDEERVAELEQWWQRSLDPAFPAELESLVADAARAAAERLKLTAVRLERELERVQASRWWRARRVVAELRPVRVLRARRREAG